jgi:hypothetical protein
VNFSPTVHAFAYAALLAAGNDKDAAVAALGVILQGQYTTNITGAGKLMTSASGEGKAFSYQFPVNFGPKEITDTTFEAIQFLKMYSSDEIDTILFRRRRNSAIATFGAICRPRLLS